MDEINRCRSLARVAWNLLTSQPRLALIPMAGFPLAFAAMVAAGWITRRDDAVVVFLALTAAATVLSALTRVAFSSAILAALRNQPWTVRGALLTGLRCWKSVLLFGALDALVTDFCGLLLVLALFGSVAASWWWCVSSLVPCAMAAGITDVQRAVIRAERVLSIIRVEMFVASTLLNLGVYLLLSLTLHLGLPAEAAIGLFYVLVLLPTREVGWQLFVTTAYEHTAPADA
jgi:hypothetical protein